MTVKEIFVTLDQAEKIFSIIEEELFAIRDTQVFIDDIIYKELRVNGKKHHVYDHNYLKGWHYYHNDDNFGGEEWLELSEGCFFDKAIARGSFIGNCNGYVQLVEFHSSKVKKYVHYITGFNQLLLIHCKTNE